MQITQELLMKAAKFQQNHKIQADVVKFDAEDEAIYFLNEAGTIVAWVGYNNTPNGSDYYIHEATFKPHSWKVIKKGE